MQHNEHYGAFFMGKIRIKKSPLILKGGGCCHLEFR